VLGSKGAGKTFAWGQLVIAQSWETFCEALGESAQAQAKIFPLLSPAHLSDEMRRKTRDTERASLLLSDSSKTSSELSNELRHAERHADGELSFWTQAIAARLGLPAAAGASVRTLETTLATQGQRIVLVIDGIEDALQVGPSQPMTETQQVRLRTLLIDLINQLRDLAPSHLGLIVFVRRDLARSAIPQNFGQFEARHRSVSLNWSPTDALRLTQWLLNEAGWSGAVSDHILSAPYSTLAQALHPFWGEKMGGKREAYTDRWVIAALSDLNGRFQARDLVRLLHHSTHSASTLPLSPSNLREAIQHCSIKKIDELEMEIKQLRSIFDKLRGLDALLRTIPIARSALPLSVEESAFLIEQGILYLDEKEQRFYMPEIIRHGLHFTQGRSGRARVLSLLRSAMRDHG